MENIFVSSVLGRHSLTATHVFLLLASAAVHPVDVVVSRYPRPRECLDEPFCRVLRCVDYIWCEDGFQKSRALSQLTDVTEAHGNIDARAVRSTMSSVVHWTCTRAF